jgi:hypothetical protein
MAININPGKALSHVQTFTSSGTFLAPPEATLAFVSIHSAQGGGGGGSAGRYTNNQNGGNGGVGIVASGWVRLNPNGGHAVTVGAGGAGGAGAPTTTSGQTGSSAGTTIFDGAITVIGSGGGVGGQNAGGQAAQGSAASATGVTSLTTVSPSGALARVSSFATQTTGAPTAAAGSSAGRYSASAGTTGASGLVHIYI